MTYNPQQQGYVHSVETGGMVDGPGIRYVIFLAGCNLRCKYCHNPDTWHHNDDQLVTVGGILREIKKYQSYLKFSGGGVTITGGEPFVQPSFLTNLLAACKESGLHTALDTSGYAGRQIAEQALALTDLLLLDFKSFNRKTYEDLTGVPLDRTLDLLRLSEYMEVPVWIRFVLVPGYTDNIDDIKRMADFLFPFVNVVKIEVLPFHKLGEHKWADLNIPYELKNVEPPSQALLDEVKTILMVQ